MISNFNSSPIPHGSNLSNLLSHQDAQNIRLQRLIQQRKRMEHMALLIEQQKQTIDILKQENSSINQQFFQLKLQNQLLTDKLTVASNHCQDLTEVLVKQISLIENLRGCLFSGLQMSEYQLNGLDQEIQTSLSLYHAITAGKANLHMNNQKDQISNLTEENQILNEKYQSLCDDYLELSKTLKIKQYELLKYQNSKHPQTLSNNNYQNLQQNLQQGALKRKHHHQGSIEKKDTNTQLPQLLKAKDNQINKLKKFIQSLKVQISQKDVLIHEHRTNEKEQKKLLSHLKAKFNEEGKALSQIAKSKQIIEVSPAQPKTEIIYEIEKPIKTSTRKAHVTQVSPVQQIIETKVFEEQNVNINSSCNKNSSHSKFMTKIQNTNIKSNINDSGYKKTVSKCIVENQ